MRTVRRLLYREVLGATLFVMASFLGLFLFFDLVGELDNVGQGGYSLAQAFGVCLFLVPGHVYELMPIAVLIGTIYALARLAQSSEFTILRTGGLGPGRALWLLTRLGLMFVALTFVMGDFVAPWADTQATLMQSDRQGGLSVEAGGAWLKDTHQTPEGPRAVTINFAAARSDHEVQGVRIFEFDGRGNLTRRITATRAQIGSSGTWQLHEARVTHWRPDQQPALPANESSAQLEWPSSLTPQVVGAAVLPLRTMTTGALFTYMSHLAENAQSAQRHEIQFWKKALYPFACLVMMALALPFAYLSARSGGMSLKVFGGIMLGISFVLLNNVASHLGLLQNWTPWIAASVPSLVYLLLSMAAFQWLVRHR